MLTLKGADVMVVRRFKPSGASCDWTPHWKLYDGGFSKGESWQYTSKCGDRQESGTVTYGAEGSRTYKGNVEKTIAVKRVSQVRLSPSSSPATVTVEEEFAPRLGMPLTYFEVIESPSPSGTERSERRITLQG